MMMHEETYQEKIETADESKMAQCKAFMKIYYLAVCALCWTVLILVGLGSKYDAWTIRLFFKISFI